MNTNTAWELIFSLAWGFSGWLLPKYVLMQRAESIIGKVRHDRKNHYCFICITNLQKLTFPFVTRMKVPCIKLSTIRLWLIFGIINLWWSLRPYPVRYLFRRRGRLNHSCFLWQGSVVADLYHLSVFLTFCRFTRWLVDLDHCIFAHCISPLGYRPTRGQGPPKCKFMYNHMCMGHGHRDVGRFDTITQNLRPSSATQLCSALRIQGRPMHEWRCLYFGSEP